jgi:hypothetical protein
VLFAGLIVVFAGGLADLTTLVALAAPDGRSGNSRSVGARARPRAGGGARSFRRAAAASARAFSRSTERDDQEPTPVVLAPLWKKYDVWLDCERQMLVITTVGVVVTLAALRRWLERRQ